MLAEKDIEKFQRLLTAAYADDLQYGIRFQAAFATVEDIKLHLEGNLCYVLERDGEIITSCSLRMPWGPNPGPDVFPHLGWVAPSRAISGWGSVPECWTGWNRKS